MLRPAPRRSRAVALLAAGALTALALGACTDSDGTPRAGGTGTAPVPTEDGPTAGATTDPAGATTRPAEPATVTWDHPTPAGYVLSETPPTETVVQLQNADLSCVLQLTHEVIPDAGIDDATYTDTAVDNAAGALGETTETAREDAVIASDAGPLAAREVTLTASTGTQEMDVRMLLRASSADQVLVGIVQICPGGSLDEAVWDEFVAGTTLHGTTATEF